MRMRMRMRMREIEQETRFVRLVFGESQAKLKT
jgi:hypothetical protein